MQNFRKLFSYTAIALCGVMTLAVTSCDDDEDPTTFADPTILVTPATTSGLPGTTVTLGVAATAEAGLASIKMNGAEVKAYSTDAKTDAFTQDFAIPATAAVGSSITVAFEVADKQSTAKTATQNVTVTVGDPGKQTETIEGAISANKTLSKDKYYLLKGNVYVQAPAELTIEAGTVIFGDKVTKGALVINRGAKIHAVGTADAPIVFTSSAPASFRNYGDWGGVVILGKSPNNQGVDRTIEGVTGTAGDDGKYGGTVADDNSGELQFARIEFAGIALSTDNELNGLTLGSVGSATTIDHVQVSYSGDDSFEWFGGNVNAKYLVSYSSWDDDLDTDFGYTGKVQYAAVIRDPNLADKSGSNAFESDNDGAGSIDKLPLTAPTFANVTVFGPHVYAALSSGALNKSGVSSNYQNGAHIRRNSALKLYNSAIVGFGVTYGFKFTDSKGAANTAADISHNYIARVVAAALADPATGLAGGAGYDVTNFSIVNTIENPLTKVDVSTVFTGLTGAATIASPAANFVPAAGSPLLSGALDLTSQGLEKTDYIGAVGTTNWLTEAWINFTPNATAY
jgi:hypothetical protein